MNIEQWIRELRTREIPRPAGENAGLRDDAGSEELSEDGQGRRVYGCVIFSGFTN